MNKIFPCKIPLQIPPRTSYHFLFSLSSYQRADEGKILRANLICDHSWCFSLHPTVYCTMLPTILTYLLTYSMEQSPSWEANRFAASQEIPNILWNPKIHYCIHKCLPPVPIQSKPPHPTSWISILILSSHLRLGLPSVLFLSGFNTKQCIGFSSLPYVLHALPIS